VQAHSKQRASLAQTEESRKKLRVERVKRNLGDPTQSVASLNNKNAEDWTKQKAL